MTLKALQAARAEIVALKSGSPASELRAWLEKNLGTEGSPVNELWIENALAHECSCSDDYASLYFPSYAINYDRLEEKLAEWIAANRSER